MRRLLLVACLIAVGLAPACGDDPPKPKTAKHPAGGTMVLIPDGKFLMGQVVKESPADFPQVPIRQVIISRPFFLGETEFTVAEYERITGRKPRNASGPDHPIVDITFPEAAELCNILSAKATPPLPPYYKIDPDAYVYHDSEGVLLTVPDPNGPGYRLPTEAEWEYACRAGSVGKWSSGNDPRLLLDFAWLKDNSDGKLRPVTDRKKPNAFGLYNMHGNAWEWTSDRFDSHSYEKLPALGTTDPRGPSRGVSRSIRGGAFDSSNVLARSSHRAFTMNTEHAKYLGLRIARTAP
jgi:formylglycine-generating enzyme required for sulfatase activity